MTKPRNDGKDHKLFDELGKAIGLLGEDGKLDISWFGSALSSSLRLASPARRAHLLEAVASVLGAEDRRGRKATDDSTPWSYYVASKKPAPPDGIGNVPIDIVLDDGTVPAGSPPGTKGRKAAIGVGARYHRDATGPGGAKQVGVELWTRAWLLGLDPEVPPSVVPVLHPLQVGMQPQLEGEAALTLPQGFLSAAAIKGGLRLGDAGTGVTTTLTLAGWQADLDPASTARVSGPASTFDFQLGPGASGGASPYVKAALHLAAFLGGSFLDAEAKVGNVAQRLREHLVPLFGSSAGPITPFPLDDIVDGKSLALADWGRQFVPSSADPTTWKLEAPATALMHLWGLVRKSDRVEDHRDSALSRGSVTAWLISDPTAGDVGLHLDGARRDPPGSTPPTPLQRDTAFDVSVGVIAGKRLAIAGGGNVRARLDLRAVLAAMSFDGVKVDGTAVAAPRLAGPAFEVRLALEPVNDAAPMMTVTVAGSPVAIGRGGLTVRWRPGSAPDVVWRFETSGTAPDVAALTASAVAQLAASLPPPVHAFVEAARTAPADAIKLVDKLRATGLAVSGSIGGVSFAVSGSAAGAPAITLTAGPITAGVAVTGSSVTATASAVIPIPLPEGLGLGLALELGGGAGALTVKLRVKAGGGDVAVPLSGVALDEAYVLALLKQLALPVATAALLQGDVLREQVAAGVALGDVLQWAGLIAKPGGATSWQMRDAAELVKRDALQVVADVAGQLVEVKKAGITISELGVTVMPTVTPAGGGTGYGLALAPIAAAPAVLTLVKEDGLEAGVRGLTVTGLTIAGGKPTFAPAVVVTDLSVQAGSKDAPLFVSDQLSLQSATVKATLTLGAGAGLAVTDVGLEVRELRLPFGSAGGGGLAGSLFGKDSKSNPGFSIGFARRGGELKIELPTRPLWIALDTQIGPLSVDRLGVDVLTVAPKGQPSAAAVDHVKVMLDARFALGPITVSASRLGVYFQPRDLRAPDQWRFDVGGLGLALEAGPVSLAGFLERVGDGDSEEFRGAALVKFAGFQIAAIGGYRKLGTTPSLFVLGALNAPLGGPPFFFVTGVAGGFGINRAFVVPDDPLRLKDHIFFTIMERGADALSDVGKMSDLIATTMTAEAGTSWFAAGVKFTSFSLIEGLALLYLRFGRTFELGIAAKATLNVPTDKPIIASVTLVLKGAFTAGDDPRLLIRADLVDSWLLSKDCRLTGSFAFGLWPNRGDCLLTIGGFHRDYKPPAHYPTGLSRLGFSWAISSAIKAEGQVYFALTPREAMAGATLTVAGSWGPLSAGFDAWFDAWIGWDPFWFDLEIGIRVWAKVFGIKVSLGVALHIWGPPVGGTATIEVAIWSFTIPFGKDRAVSSAPIAIGRFASKHLELALPAAKEDATANLGVRGRAGSGATAGTPPPGSRGLISIEVVRGAQAVRERAPAAAPATVADGSTERPFRIGPEFVLDIRSRVPVRDATYQRPGAKVVLADAATFGFAPCKEFGVGSFFDVTHAAGVELSTPGVSVLARTPMPEAMFGAKIAGPGATGDPTVALSMGIRIDGTARLSASAGVVQFDPELGAGPGERMALPLAWDGHLPVIADDGGGDDGVPVREVPVREVPVREVLGREVPVREVPVLTHVATIVQPTVVPPVIGARIFDAVAPPRPLDTTTTVLEIDRELREVAVVAPRERPRSLRDVVLHDLRPSEAQPLPGAIRAGTVGGAALTEDSRALIADGVVVRGGESLILHDLVGGTRVVARGDQVLEVLWVGAFGIPLGGQRLAAGEVDAVMPDGTQRALIRGLGRDATHDGDRRPTAAGFDRRTPAIRIGDRAWWARDCMIGLIEGAAIEGQPTLVRAGEVTGAATGLRLWFAPAGDGSPDQVGEHAAGEDGLELRLARPARILALTVSLDPHLPAEVQPLGHWRRRELELGEPRLIPTEGGLLLVWQLDDDQPCTVDLELVAGVQLTAAALVPRGRPDLRERLLDDGRALVFEDEPRAAGGETRLRLSLPSEALPATEALRATEVLRDH